MAAQTLMLPSTEVFNCISNGDVEGLRKFSSEDLRPFLPWLVGYANSTALSMRKENASLTIKEILLNMPVGNRIASYFKLDFDALRDLDDKSSVTGISSRNIRRELRGICVQFEMEDTFGQFKILVKDLLRLLNLSEKQKKADNFELLECDGLRLEVGDMLCILVSKLPGLLPLIKVVEGLLKIQGSLETIIQLVANMPSFFDQVIQELISNGESQDEISSAGRHRTLLLRQLCAFNPQRTLYVQQVALNCLKQPSLVLYLGLDQAERTQGDDLLQDPVVMVMSSLVLKANSDVRAWFGQYIKLNQHKYRRVFVSALTLVRKYLMTKLNRFENSLKCPGGSDGGITQCPGGSDGGSTQRSGGSDGRSTQRPGGSDGGSTQRPGGSDGGSTQRPGGSDGGSTQRPGGSDGGSTQRPGGSDGGSTQRPGGSDGGSTQRPGGSDGGSTQRPGGSEELGLLENDDPLLERGISEEEMDTDKPLETKPSDEEFYSCPMASHHLSDTSCMELSQLIRVFCGLKLSGLFVWKSEGYTILRLTTGLAPPHTNCGVNLIKVLFASLLACPFLISTKKREAAVLNWFQWLVENQSSYDNDSSSYGEMLLMAAIHFQDRQVSLIHNLVSNTLGFSVQHAVRPGKHTDIRELFLSVFSEDVVCTQALRVPPTPGFNGKMTGFYPVHCVYNLLKSQAFSNHSISVTSWVYNQIVVSSEPIHPVLPQLIQELVAAILAPPNRSMYQEAKSIFNQPLIPEGQLLVALHGSGNTEEDMSSLVVQSLILFYVLLYHEKWLKSLKTFTTWTKSFPPSYSPRLLSVTPVKYLLSHMRKHRKEFAVLYPSIVKLVTSHLPHITMVTYTTFDLSTSQLSSDKVTLSPEKAENVLLQLTTSPSRALQLVQRLLQLQPIFLKHYSSCILSTFPLLHDDSVPRPIQEGVCLLWERLNTVLTEKFWIDTVNSLSGQNKMRYSQEDLVEDPLLVLKCEPLVFQYPPLLEVVLQVLSGLMSLSRVWIEEQGHVQSVASRGGYDTLPPDKDAVIDTYASLQESAVVQMLLEICLHSNTGEESYGPLLTVSREVQCIICSFIHQMFIANPMLAKLVHFQGYPIVLIKMMVEGVPSMHICLDFISELLDRPEVKKQQFGFQLAARLLAQYPLSTTTETTQLFVKKLNSLIDTVPREGHVDVFVPILPFLVCLCKAFPPLMEEITVFLLHLGRCHVLEPQTSVQTKTAAAESGYLRESICFLFNCKEERCTQEHHQQEERNIISCAVDRTFKLIAESLVVQI